MQQNTGIFNIFNPLVPGNSDGQPKSVLNLTASPLYSQEVESTAVFGQVDWDITDRLMVSVGGRWLDEEKDACMTITGYSSNVNDQLFGNPKRSVDNVDAAGYEKTLETHLDFPGGAPVVATSFGVEGLCPAWASSVYNEDFDGSASWDEFTPRIAVSMPSTTGWHI